jgi:flavin reductase (DIM6/NTAB) family NADH-FMN oxidoreductase RutF
MKDIAMSPEAATSRAFRDALGRFATGVTIVTTAGVEGPLGFTANSFASVSLEPPLVLWSPARAASRFCHFRDAQFFSIHVLGIDQFGLIERFSRRGEGFAGMDHDLSIEGVPLLRDALARFDCVQHATHDGGDHLIIVGRVTRFGLRDGSPLVFSQGAYGGFARGG